MKISNLSNLRVIGFAAIAALCLGCADSGKDTDGDEADLLLDRIGGTAYTLTARANPSGGGSVSPNPKKDAYSPGESVSVTASAANRYQFINWSGASTSTSSAVNIKMDANKTLTANFKRLYELTVSASPSSGGSAYKDPNNSTYLDGTKVTVRASANSNYVFTGWSDGSTENPRTITITGDLTLTANFKRTYTLTVYAEPYSGGTVTRSLNSSSNLSNNVYFDGTEVTVTAKANSGYAFTGWSGASSSTSSSVKVTVNGDMTLTANFTPIYRLTTDVSPSSAAGSIDRSPNPVDNNGGYRSGTEVTVTARPNTGYTFKYWSGASSSTSPTTYITMNGNATLTAVFEQDKYSISYTVEPYNSGYVELSPTGVYTYGTRVTVTAKPYSGYVFTGWSGASSSKDASITITVDGPKSLVANFKLRYTVTYNVNGGSGTPPAAQVVDGGSSVTVQGRGNMYRGDYPYEYNFGGWNTYDDSTGTHYAAGSSFTPTSDVTLYAIWTSTVIFDANGGAGAPPRSMTVKAGGQITLPRQGNMSPPPDKTFRGWMDEYAMVYNTNTMYTPKGNTVLYAIWGD